MSQTSDKDDLPADETIPGIKSTDVDDDFAGTSTSPGGLDGGYERVGSNL